MNLLLPGLACLAGVAAAAAPLCRVEQRGSAVALHAPGLVWHLDRVQGLRTTGLGNRLTGARLALDGPELEADLGLPGGPLVSPQWGPAELVSHAEGDAGEAVFRLVSAQPAMAARVTYRWRAGEPVVHRSVALTNTAAEPVTLLNLRLGSYHTTAAIEDREQGFPVYLDGQCFLSLAHPAGWATGRDGQVSLRQYPGSALAPGATFASMEAVLGVGRKGAGRAAFLAHVRSRTRRVVRGHDRPYAVYEPFGARPDGDFNETEGFVLEQIGRVAEGQRLADCRFDILSVDFWVDYRGDLKRCDPERFPRGLEPIVADLQRVGVTPGLWIDSSMVGWSIGGNPDVQGCLNFDPDHPESVSQVSWGRVSFCRASEPIRAMYTDAFRHHVRDHGVRLLKFDNFASTCVNPRHGHLPGIYSTEPIIDSVIDFLHQLDAESPDVFLMLYWGYRSPWWLLHGDTLFDSGLGIEGASPSTQPAPHARDSITQKLDQAQRHASDVPALGKDSLGVWLSDWSWNSQVGPARWPEGMVMDICRGSLLAQPWAGREQLSDAEWQTMADLLALLRAQPECFANPRFILGDPFRNEPYGYACSDGRRAFVALNNAAWHDTRVELKLNHAWGLPDGGRWDLYRCYPAPARLEPPAEPFGERATLWLRPFDVVLLEVVPHGGRPSLARTLPGAALPTRFAESSAAVRLMVERPAPPAPAAEGIWHVATPVKAVSTGGTVLEPQPDGSLLARGERPDSATYTVTLNTPLAGITGLRVEALPDDSLPGHGPGRAVNGNFALRSLSLTVAPAERPDEAQPVALVRPQCSYEQTGYGGWPVAAAVDGDPRTGWSIDPHEGRRQIGDFELAAPVGAAGGSVLTVTLEMGERQHTLGRFRLALTTAAPPLPPPPGDVLVPFVLTGDLPATATGGMVVVSARLPGGPHPPEYGNLGAEFAHQGLLDGRPAAWEPVLGQATYPSCWQAWRLPLPPAAKVRRFALRLETALPLEVPGSFAAWWLPR